MEKIFALYTSGKRLISRKYKLLTKADNKTSKNPISLWNTNPKLANRHNKNVYDHYYLRMSNNDNNKMSCHTSENHKSHISKIVRTISVVGGEVKEGSLFTVSVNVPGSTFIEK